MSTSGATSQLMTAGQIVLKAAQKLGTLAPGDDLTADEYDTGVQDLNWMIKSFQADGCNMWRDLDIEITWPADEPECTLAPTVIDVRSANYYDGSNFERWLDRWEKADYDILPNKLAAGNPTIFNFVKQTGNPRLRVWPVPTTDITLRCAVARVIEDVTDVSQNVDLPQEWTECVFYNLACRMAPTMGTIGTSPLTVAKAEQIAAHLYQQLSNADRPGSVTFRSFR